MLLTLVELIGQGQVKVEELILLIYVILIDTDVHSVACSHLVKHELKVSNSPVVIWGCGQNGNEQ